MSEYVVDLTDVKKQKFSWSMEMLYDSVPVREEIVRCRDCIGLVETWDGWECERFSGEYHRAEPKGFCAWGERRTDDN